MDSQVNVPRVWIQARQRKGRATYFLRWCDPNSTRERWDQCGEDRGLAETKRALKITELIREQTTGVRDIKWPEFVHKYAEWLGGVCSQVHATSVRRTLDEFTELCRPATPLGIDTEMIDSFVSKLQRRGSQGKGREDQKLSSSTINRKLTEIKGALRKARKWKHLREHDMPDFEPLATDDPMPTHLSGEHKRRLLGACLDTRWRLACHLSLVTGMRKAEVIGLTWDRVDIDGMAIKLTNTKGKRDARLSFDSESQRMFRELFEQAVQQGSAKVANGRAVPRAEWVFATADGRQWGRNNFSRDFAVIVARADLVDHKDKPLYTFHNLRSTFARDLEGLGLTAPQLQRCMRHASFETTRRHYLGQGASLEDSFVLAETLGEKIG